MHSTCDTASVWWSRICVQRPIKERAQSAFPCRGETVVGVDNICSTRALRACPGLAPVANSLENLPLKTISFSLDNHTWLRHTSWKWFTTVKMVRHSVIVSFVFHTLNLTIHWKAPGQFLKLSFLWFHLPFPRSRTVTEFLLFCMCQARVRQKGSKLLRMTF